MSSGGIEAAQAGVMESVLMSSMRSEAGGPPCGGPLAELPADELRAGQDGRSCGVSETGPADQPSEVRID